MDLREYYAALASTITEADLRLAAVVLSAHVGKANAITKAELKSRARELNERAYSLFSVSLPSPTTINRLQGGLF